MPFGPLNGTGDPRVALGGGVVYVHLRSAKKLALRSRGHWPIWLAAHRPDATSWPSTMSRIDTLKRGAKSTALQRILRAYDPAKTNKSRHLTDGVDLVPAQGVGDCDDVRQ